MKKHEDFQENLTGFVLGELSDEQNHLIRKHLAECKPCRSETERMGKVLETADCLRVEQIDEATCQQARQNVLDAVEQLDSEGDPSIKSWWKTPIVQYAAAAALIIGALLALHYLGPKQKLPDKNGLATHTTEGTQTTHPIKPADTPGKELRQAADYYEKGNVQGLVILLQSGQEETKQAAAHYLAQIGDTSALDSLEILSSQWTGDPQDNPYQQAIDAIRKRSAEINPSLQE